LYVEYWQKKLRHNKDISFPNTLRDEIVNLTGDFSFAYLKEALYVPTRAPKSTDLTSPLCSVSALVLLATDESDPRPTFEQMIKKQIATLRKQLDETETKPSAHALQEPIAITSCEPQCPSQVRDNQIPKITGQVNFELHARDIQNRAKAAVACGRSFIA
jgi:hypothetical protein